MRLRLGRRLWQAGVDALQSVGGVHDPAHRAAQIEERLHMLPISSPDGHGSRILLPCRLESFKLTLGRRQAGGGIDSLELGGKGFAVSGGYILEGIAD